MGRRMLPIAFFPDRPSLPWQRNMNKASVNLQTHNTSLVVRVQLAKVAGHCRDIPLDAYCEKETIHIQSTGIKPCKNRQGFTLKCEKVV